MNDDDDGALAPEPATPTRRRSHSLELHRTRITLPVTWLDAHALAATAFVVTMHREQHAIQRQASIARWGYDTSWWSVTKRQIDSGYVAFCERRGLPLDAREWNACPPAPRHVTRNDVIDWREEGGAS